MFRKCIHNEEILQLKKNIFSYCALSTLLSSNQTRNKDKCEKMSVWLRRVADVSVNTLFGFLFLFSELVPASELGEKKLRKRQKKDTHFLMNLKENSLYVP